MPIEWFWSVFYKDGQFITEIDYKQKGLGFKDLDMDQIMSVMISNVEEPERPLLVVSLVDDMRPIFFRRHRELINLETGDTFRYLFATCVGWQKTVNGCNVKSMTWLFHEDGSVAVTDRDVDDLDVGG